MSSPDPSAWVVHKFGGSSVADADCFRCVAHILETLPPGRLGVVLSACRGVTDALLGLVTRAEAQDDSWRGDLDALRARHAGIALSVLTPQAAQLYMAAFDRDRHDIEGILHTVKLTRSAAQNIRDLIAGYGEIWSTKLFREFFAGRGKRPGAVRWIDAREVVLVEWGPLGPAVQWDESRARLRTLVPVDGFEGTLIITGFIASDRRGVQTTLGRNGSDFSGSIFGSLLDAAEIHIWTDVDGVLSADPRLVPEAELLPALSYSEACELAYFGARVLHPQTMAPAIAHGIPIRIRNTFRPEHAGTLVSAVSDPASPVRGLTAFDGLALVSVEGAGMIGVPGTAERVFGALHRARVSVVMISQGSSEHSICCVLQAADAERALASLREGFARELTRGQIQRVSAEAGMTVLAVVGDGMSGTPGVAARLFASLARAGVNVRAISQGASERNISVVVASADGARGLRAIHAGFYLSAQTLSVGLVGPGHVGRALLTQIAAASERLLRDAHLDLRVRAIATSTRMALDERRLDLSAWPARLAAGEPTDLARLAQHVRAPHLPHAVLIDCSASDAVAGHYPEWLAAGLHVITPNKHAGGGPWPRYAAIRDAVAKGPRFRYEATVGAGLPILDTYKKLAESGDRVLKIEGCVSGTLGFLLSELGRGRSFSESLRRAMEKGFTEPDPRDDLSGTDVGRKALILGRLLGFEGEPEEVQVESLVPAELQKLPLEAFLQRLPELNGPWAAKVAAAKGKGAALRYIATVTKNKIAVGLKAVDGASPFAGLKGTDNQIVFTTSRYRENPLVVTGPGAGPAVTAAGVLNDILGLAG